MPNALDFNLYKGMLWPFAFNLTKNREESEDLIQDTFCRALNNLDKFSEGSNMKGWLFTIMRNIFINDYHKKQRGSYLLDNSENQYCLNSCAVERNFSEAVFLGEAITRAMNEISKDFTEPFMMHYEGIPYAEIAEKFEMPLGTVKSRIFFARKELQKKLKAMDIVNSSSGI